jgi:hypothetical protein
MKESLLLRSFASSERTLSARIYRHRVAGNASDDWQQQFFARGDRISAERKEMVYI